MTLPILQDDVAVAVTAVDQSRLSPPVGSLFSCTSCYGVSFRHRSTAPQVFWLVTQLLMEFLGFSVTGITEDGHLTKFIQEQVQQMFPVKRRPHGR